MHKIIIFLNSLVLLISLPSMAYDCDDLISVNKEIKKSYSNLETLKDLQDSYLEAKAIQDRLIDPSDPGAMEIIKLAEAYMEESIQIEDEQAGDYKALGGSIGAMILSSLFIKHINRSNPGLWNKFKTQFLSKKNFFKKYLLNVPFIISTYSTVVLSIKVKDNMDRREMLRAIILKLNKLKDLSPQIKDLKDEIEELSAYFEAEANNKLKYILRENHYEFSCQQ